jgi:HTH-type transcriptional regulator, sugar sensing transcriptional regulator
VPPSHKRGPPRRGQTGDGESVAVPTSVENDQLTRLLGELGLTRTESRVYLALLRGSGATAAEAAASAGVPRAKVYEALRALESRGFCHGSGGPVARHTAADPDVALRNWIIHRDQERAMVAEREHAHVETLVRALPRGAQPATAGAPDFMDGISGRLPTTEALESLIARAEDSLDEMLQPPFLQPRSRWNAREIEALARGVTVRVIYTPDALIDPQRYRGLVEHGGEARILERLPMKLLVRDDEEALISLRDAATGAQSTTSARVHHPDLVAPLATLFAQAWRRARPLSGSG